MFRVLWRTVPLCDVMSETTYDKRANTSTIWAFTIHLHCHVKKENPTVKQIKCNPYSMDWSHQRRSNVLQEHKYEAFDHQAA